MWCSPRSLLESQTNPSPTALPYPFLPPLFLSSSTRPTSSSPPRAGSGVPYHRRQSRDSTPRKNGASTEQQHPPLPSLLPPPALESRRPTSGCCPHCRLSPPYLRLPSLLSPPLLRAVKASGCVRRVEGTRVYLPAPSWVSAWVRVEEPTRPGATPREGFLAQEQATVMAAPAEGVMRALRDPDGPSDDTSSSRKATPSPSGPLFLQQPPKLLLKQFNPRT